MAHIAVRELMGLELCIILSGVCVCVCRVWNGLEVWLPWYNYYCYDCHYLLSGGRYGF